MEVEIKLLSQKMDMLAEVVEDKFNRQGKDLRELKDYIREIVGEQKKKIRELELQANQSCQDIVEIQVKAGTSKEDLDSIKKLIWRAVGGLATAMTVLILAAAAYLKGG